MEHDFTQPVDSIDKLPEQVRGLYTQGQDGKFVVDEKFKQVAGVITGLNNSLKASRDEAKRNKPTDLTALAEYGADPAAIKAEFDKRVADLVAKGGDAAKAVEKVRSEMAAAHAAALTAEKGRGDGYKAQLHELLVKNDAVLAITEAKGIPDLLLPFIMTQVKVVEENGKQVVHVLDALGERRYSTMTGQPMTIKELVAAMKTDAKYGRLFESDNQNGGGGANNNGTRRPVPNAAPDTSANGKISAGLAKRFPGRG